MKPRICMARKQHPSPLRKQSKTSAKWTSKNEEKAAWHKTSWMRPRSRELLQNIQTCKKGGRKRQEQGERQIKKKKKALEAVRKNTGERGQQLWAREQRSITCNLKDAQFYRVIEKAKAKWIRVYNEAFARSYGFKALNWLKAINKNAHNRMTYCIWNSPPLMYKGRVGNDSTEGMIRD